MICGRCKSSAPDGKRFCPKCGNDLLPAPDVDPLAATALANPKELQAIRDAAVRGDIKAPAKVVSPRTVPMARTSSPGPAPKPPRGPTEIPAIPPPPTQVTAPMSALPKSSNPRGAAPPVPVPAPSAPAVSAPGLVKGSHALVRWSDGKQYPGVVEQVVDGRVLVVFPGNQRHWVALSFVTAAPR